MYRVNIVSANPTVSASSSSSSTSGSSSGSSSGSGTNVILQQAPQIIGLTGGSHTILAGQSVATAAGTTALPIGTIVSIQQQQQPQTSSSASSAVPTPTATIIGLSASTLSALNAATVAAGGTIASGGATITPVTGSTGTVGVAGTAGQLLKVTTAAGNNNSISILKIGDDIMLKAVKVEPIPSDTGGGTGSGGGGGAAASGSSAPSASVNGSSSTSVTANTVTVTTIPSTNGGGHVVFGGKRRHESNEEWISSPSPGSVQGSAPPLSPSPGSQSHTYTTTMSNGYSSPMSTGIYDPYSPNGKMGCNIPERGNNVCLRCPGPYACYFRTSASVVAEGFSSTDANAN
ncbi:AGAP012209-PA-like protein [Anopheles sinensis]|uniref:AGAP012209-PA-like protein n=1 Tax=Anopheles sinensis TaxID=74873 RepID=A0A084WHH5_ANOSI|nr:AGAP012209-PA-like protein [Anopheles sinensis]